MIKLNTLFSGAGSAYSYIKSGYRKTKNALLFKNSPMVNLGWYYKEGKVLKEATLPLPVVKRMPQIVKGMLFGTALTLVIGSIYAEKEKRDCANAVPYNIQRAKEKAAENDSIVHDDILPLPYKLAKTTQNPTTWAGRFYHSLRDNKENLMQDLNINNEEYNQLAVLAIKLSREESSFGGGTKYKIYDKIHRDETGLDVLATARGAKAAAERTLNDILRFKFSSIADDIEIQDSDRSLSLGMTRYKITDATEEEKELFDKYGITYENNRSNIVDPEQSAIATIIHMATLRKLYPTYLENAEALKPDLNDPKVKKAIKNAQKILFNDDLRPPAIEDLRTGRYDVPSIDEEKKGGEVEVGMGYFPKSDIEDLKIYARTVILSPDAHLIAMWNGRGVLPNPNKSRRALDETYVNLLHIAAQKGYVANIDKKSQVIYD